MRGMLKAIVVAAAVAAAWTPVPARADGFINFWAGRQFPSTADQGRGAFGLTAGGTGSGIVAGELEFGYSPSFFGTQNDFGHNTVLDLTINATFGMPLGNWRSGAAVRPFFRAGAGLIRTQIDGGSVFNVSSSENHLGYDLGGGVIGFFNERVGLRGDITYFRTMTGNVINGLDLGSLHYWRWSAGLVIR
jgi:Outer membrane protein beta-barrel domain